MVWPQTHKEWRKKKAPLKQVLNISDAFRVDQLPRTIENCYRCFDYALNDFIYLLEEQSHWVSSTRQSAKDWAWRFEDYLRLVIERRTFVSREDVKELLRHRRMLIELGLLEKVYD